VAAATAIEPRLIHPFFSSTKERKGPTGGLPWKFATGISRMKNGISRVKMGMKK